MDLKAVIRLQHTLTRREHGWIIQFHNSLWQFCATSTEAPEDDLQEKAVIRQYASTSNWICTKISWWKIICEIYHLTSIISTNGLGCGCYNEKGLSCTETHWWRHWSQRISIFLRCHMLGIICLPSFEHKYY
jgi:hypothetical protein